VIWSLRKAISLCLLSCLPLAALGQASSPQSPSPSSKPAAPQSPSSNTPASTQAEPAKPAAKHSTPEDRQRLVSIAHKLEAAPLDRSLEPDRDWAVKWVVAAPDVHVRICTSLLAELRRPRYEYRPVLSAQLLISSAAFVIEHPEQGIDASAQSVAGMEGVLKAYSSILKEKPQATAKSLDDLLQKQKAGKLAETVRGKTSNCQ